MMVSRTSATHLPRPLSTTPPPEQAAEPQDGFSLKKTAAEGVLFFMGRRIPTMVPEISSERAQEIQQKLRPGDVILTCDCAYPGWARMEFWTVRSHYTHAAYYGGDGKIYEAVGGGVLEAKLEDYFKGRLKVAVVRPSYPSEDDVKAAVDYCKSHLGKKYDSVFDTGDDKEFYCSELVFKALKSMPHPIEAPSTTLRGKPFVAPDAFLSIPGSSLVHDDKSDYWKNKLGHWPLAAFAAGGGAVGGMLGGSGGAAIGFGVGLLGSILGLNKIQVGQFAPSLDELAEGKRHDNQKDEAGASQA